MSHCSSGRTQNPYHGFEALGCPHLSLSSLSMSLLPVFQAPAHTGSTLSLPMPASGHAMFSAWYISPHIFPWLLPPYDSGLSSNVTSWDRLILNSHHPTPPPCPLAVHIACDTTSRPCENVTFSWRPSLTTPGQEPLPRHLPF